MKKNEAFLNSFTGIKMPKISIAAAISTFILVWLFSTPMYGQQPDQVPGQRLRDRQKRMLFRLLIVSVIRILPKPWLVKMCIRVQAHWAYRPF